MPLRLVVIFVLLVAACAGPTASQSPDPSPATSGEPRPLFREPPLPDDASQWDRLIARVGTRGAPDKQAALDAFAIAFTPLPGTTEPEGEVAPVEDGTLAVAWIRHFWDELTPEQQSFADSLIKGEVPAALRAPVQPLAVVGPPLIPDRAALAATNDWQALANEMQDIVKTRLGRELGAQLVVKTLAEPTDPIQHKWDVAGWADGRDANGGQSGKLATCTIVITPPMVDADPQVARMTMAHEMFHCFHFARGTVADLYLAPPWVTEGAARYAEMSIAGEGTGEIASDKWSEWLQDAKWPLYARAYDAFGVYYLLQNTGTNVWSVIDQILEAGAGGSLVGYKKLAEIGGDSFLDTWGSRYFMLPAENAGNFRYAGDGLEDNVMIMPSEPVSITPGEQAHEEAFPYAANVFIAGLESDVVVLRTPGGHGWVRTMAGENTLDATNDQLFCTRPEGCDCPDRPPDFESVFVPFESFMLVGMTGHELGEEITIYGYDLETYCEEQPHSPDPGKDVCGELQSCPGSNGDPHLVTIDGRDYDFQAVGEFTLLRSADDSFEIQARQQPWRDSRTVSINTAVAIGLNDDRAVMYAESSGTRLSVNGADVPITQPSAAGDLQIAAVPDGLRFDAPDGTVVWVVGQGTWGLNVTVAPSDDVLASGSGLIGPVGGDWQLPALPDGSQVPAGGDIRTAIYGVLGPAWEVTADSSLFDYAPGQGPAAFRDPTVPEPGAPLGFDDLTPAQQEAGLDACFSVANQILREQCAFDVTVTGDLGFVESYRVTEEAVALPPPVVEPQPTDEGPPPTLPGGDACGALSSDEILDLTGFELLSAEPGVSTPQIFTAGCHWILDAREADTTWDIYLNVQSPGGRAAFDSYLVTFPNLEHVPGIGDDAVLHAANSVVAVKGDTRFEVQYINLRDPNEEAVLIELTKAIAPRL